MFYLSDAARLSLTKDCELLNLIQSDSCKARSFKNQFLCNVKYLSNFYNESRRTLRLCPLSPYLILNRQVRPNRCYISVKVYGITLVLWKHKYVNLWIASVASVGNATEFCPTCSRTFGAKPVGFLIRGKQRTLDSARSRPAHGGSLLHVFKFSDQIDK